VEVARFLFVTLPTCLMLSDLFYIFNLLFQATCLCLFLLESEARKKTAKTVKINTLHLERTVVISFNSFLFSPVFLPRKCGIYRNVPHFH